MLLFLCDYAIFYAPIMPLYAHIYAPNYADYAQIMQIMLKLCQLCQNMQFMLNYAIMLNYARRLARGGGAASGPPSSRQVAPPVWPNTLRPKKTHTRNALIAMSTIRTPDLLVTVPVPVAVRYPDRPVNSSAKWRARICSYLKLLRTERIQLYRVLLIVPAHVYYPSRLLRRSKFRAPQNCKISMY